MSVRYHEKYILNNKNCFRSLHTYCHLKFNFWKGVDKSCTCLSTDDLKAIKKITFYENHRLVGKKYCCVSDFAGKSDIVLEKGREKTSIVCFTCSLLKSEWKFYSKILNSMTLSLCTRINGLKLNCILSSTYMSLMMTYGVTSESVKYVIKLYTAINRIWHCLLSVP